MKDDIAAYGSELMGEKETNRGASHETENFAFYSWCSTKRRNFYTSYGLKSGFSKLIASY